jgi:hypothetical protein
MHKPSQQCMRRKKWRWGRNYTYIPRPQLVKRLASELNMTEQEIRNQIAEERMFILKYGAYYQ